MVTPSVPCACAYTHTESSSTSTFSSSCAAITTFLSGSLAIALRPVGRRGFLTEQSVLGRGETIVHAPDLAARRTRIRPVGGDKVPVTANQYMKGKGYLRFCMVRGSFLPESSLQRHRIELDATALLLDDLLHELANLHQLDP